MNVTFADNPSYRAREMLHTVRGLDVLFGAAASAGLVGLLAFALVRIAQPARTEPLPATPPYR